MNGFDSQDMDAQARKPYLDQPILAEAKIPEGFGSQGGDKMLKTALANREFGSNATNFKATKSLAQIVKTKSGEAYFMFWHNGEPFESPETIISKGIMPLTSDNRGNALNGVGLVTCAGMLSDSEHRLIVGSKTKKTGKWYYGSGHLDSTRGRTWVATDATEEWTQVMKDVGGKPLDEFTVHYACRISIPTRETARKNLLVTDVSIFNTCIAPEIYDGLVGEFGEAVIDPNAPEEQKNLRSIGSYQREVEGGSSRRPTTSFGEYIERYMTKSHPWEVYSDEFEIVLNSDINRRLVGIKAKARFYVFEGKTNKAEGGSNTWLSNVRSGITGRGRMMNKTAEDLAKFDKEYTPKREAYNLARKAGQKTVPPVAPHGFFGFGGGSAPGAKPIRKAFLTIPVVCDRPNMSKENERALKRFSTNAVAFRRASQIMNRLGLPYSECADPFVICYIDIIDAKGIEDDEHSKITPFDSIKFLLEVAQKPDFTIGDTFAERFIEAACEALIDKIPDDLRSYLESLFPSNLQDCVPLGADLDISGGKNEINPRFRIYDLTNNGEIMRPSARKNGGNLDLGMSVLAVVWDCIEKSFVRPSEIVWKTGYTRGIAAVSCGQAAVQFVPGAPASLNAIRTALKIPQEDEIPVISFHIPAQITTLKPDGSTEITLPKDYTYGTSLPSRNIKATCRNETLNFGAIRSIVPQDHGASDPVSPKESDSGQQNNPSQQVSDRIKRHTSAYHDVRQENVFCTYIWKRTGDIFKINPANPLLKKYYMKADTVGTKSTIILNNIFYMLWSLARGIYEPLKPSSESGAEATIKHPPEEECWNDGIDWVINQAVGKMLTDNKPIQDMLAEVDAYREKINVKKAQASEAIAAMANAEAEELVGVK